MSKLISAMRKQRGQGMTEYIIIVALIAVAAIGVYSMFGQAIRHQVAGLSKEVSGQDGGTEVQNAQTSAATAATRAQPNKGLGDYNKGNDHATGGADSGGGSGG